MSGLAEKSSVLYQLTWTKAEWVWDVQHTEPFELLKKAVVELPVLTWSVYLGYWCIRCCNRSWVEPGSGGQGTNHCFHSISLNNAQWSYCTTRKELLAVVVFTCHSFHHYMLGRAFTMRTDHTSLVWLMCFKQIGGQLSRWLEDLSQYAYIIEHRSDKKHCNADGLSRIPEGTTCDCYISGQDMDSLLVEGVHVAWRCTNSGRDLSEMLMVYFRWWYIMCSEKNSTWWVRGLQLQAQSKQNETKGDSTYLVRVSLWVLHVQVPLRPKVISSVTKNSALQLAQVLSQQIGLCCSVRCDKWESTVRTSPDQISWSSIPKMSSLNTVERCRPLSHDPMAGDITGSQSSRTTASEPGYSALLEIQRLVALETWCSLLFIWLLNWSVFLNGGSQLATQGTHLSVSQCTDSWSFGSGHNTGTNQEEILMVRDVCRCLVAHRHMWCLLLEQAWHAYPEGSSWHLPGRTSRRSGSHGHAWTILWWRFW